MEVIYLRCGQFLDLSTTILSTLSIYVGKVNVGPSKHHLSFTQWRFTTAFPETIRAFIKEYNSSRDNPWLTLRLVAPGQSRVVGVVGAGFPDIVPVELGLTRGDR